MLKDEILIPLLVIGYFGSLYIIPKTGAYLLDRYTSGGKKNKKQNRYLKS